jgi:hypothetical protein
MRHLRSTSQNLPDDNRDIRRRLPLRGWHLATAVFAARAMLHGKGHDVGRKMVENAP